MTDLYAVRTTLQPTPEHAARGCPTSGWIHEGHPPYRVIASPHPERLPTGTLGEAMPYDGEEPTVPVNEWLNRP